MYDKQYDLVRVPMTMSTLPAPVDGAQLKVTWDVTQATVPIRVN